MKRVVLVLLALCASASAQPITGGSGLQRVVHTGAFYGLGTNPNPLDLRHDCATNSLQIWNGSSWVCSSGSAVFGGGTTNTTTKWTGPLTLGNAWPTDDATTWGVASRFTITEANGNFRSFGTGTIDGAATLSSTATIATSLSVGQASTAIGTLSVKSADAGTALAASSWDSKWTNFGPNVGNASGASSGAIGIGYSTTSDEGQITTAAPGSAWKQLRTSALSYVIEVGGNSATGLGIDSSGNLTVKNTFTANSTGSFGGALNMNSNKITSCANGTASSDVACFGQIASGVNAAVSGVSGRVGVFNGTNTITGYAGFTSDTSGNVTENTLAIGTTTVGTHTLELFGVGQTVAALTDAGNKGGEVFVAANQDTTGAGGVLSFAFLNDGSTFTRSAALKLLEVSGAGSGTGDLAFLTRNATGDTALTERMRIAAGGAVTIQQTLGVTGALTASSTAHIVGALTEDSTASIAGALTLSNTVQATERIRFTGQEYLAAAHTDTNGPALLLMVNRTSDRRIALVDSANEALGSSAPQLQFGIDASAAYIDSGSTDAGTAKTLNINTRITSALVIGGGVTMNSTANVVGDFSVNTTSATIAASTGNTVLGGTLSIKGATMTLGTASINAQEKDPDGTQRPTIAGCGTSPTIVGSDKSGYFITGSSNTATCTITFHTAFSAASCVVFNPAGTAATATVPPVTATLAVSAISIGGPISKYVWECEDH